jgi:hypothetical protein
MSRPPDTVEMLLTLEPVSPELVLVDPELAQRERARLEERARLARFVEAAERRRVLEVVEPQAEEPARATWRSNIVSGRRRVLVAALMCSLFVNGVLVADLVTGTHAGGSTPLAARPTPTASTTEELNTSAPVASKRTPTLATAAVTRVVPLKAAVERKLVSLILTAPASKLPRMFVDPATGLVKNNVEVRCHRAVRRSFLCAVRLPHAVRRALVVRYRVSRNGAARFTWYGVRDVS